MDTCSLIHLKSNSLLLWTHFREEYEDDFSLHSSSLYMQINNNNPVPGNARRSLSTINKRGKFLLVPSLRNFDRIVSREKMTYFYPNFCPREVQIHTRFYQMVREVVASPLFFKHFQTSNSIVHPNQSIPSDTTSYQRGADPFICRIDSKIPSYATFTRS
jgi:hypothetical protein